MGHSPNRPRPLTKRVARRGIAASLFVCVASAAAAAVILATCVGGQAPIEAGSNPAQSLARSIRAQPDELQRAIASAPPGTPAGTPALTPTATVTPTPPPFVWPADGTIAQGMNASHPTGIDIAVGAGDPIRSVRDGRVIFAAGDPCCSYGLFIIVEHAEGWTSLYGHLSEFAVTAGEEVTQGQLLGRAGATGAATGPHLHFELRHSGVRVDPFPYLPHRDGIFVPAEIVAPPTPTPRASPRERTPPTATTTSVPGEVLSAAADWMAVHLDTMYAVDRLSCGATRAGPNWSVSCQATVVGCAGPSCLYTLTACVFEQPLLVTDACPRPSS